MIKWDVYRGITWGAFLLLRNYQGARNITCTQYYSFADNAWYNTKQLQDYSMYKLVAKNAVFK